MKTKLNQEKLKDKKNYFLSCLSAKNKPIKNKAVQTKPKRALKGLVSALHRFKNKAPKIRPNINIIITIEDLFIF
ncbi:hypothetical protein IDH20_04390 [Pelagibacterales bacterium SAG-MED39]|nr:hypothetical protein [Pelagibacterales bacterium SAG-MED39]